ncbi:GntR family transcriptional regulator [Saccharopolyspora sp. NPDC050389]|uniref:GntR family transcriptional regulator n=1 Tax=Saccharopolyspora sp. NPDC050389 TaxID=3155516 RepID=UPI0033E8B5FF
MRSAVRTRQVEARRPVLSRMTPVGGGYRRLLLAVMAMSKLESSSLLTDRVFTAIREEIMNGGMPAGHRLRIRDIAAQLGTSVMPVREAIRRLEEAGLAESIPHKGAVVRGLTLEELRQIYHVRRLLEVDAARLGAPHATESTAAMMEMHCAAITASVAEEDVVGALDADEALLTELYAAGGNTVLLDVIQGLWERCRVYKIVGARKAIEEDDRSLWSFQPRLVEAVRAHDAQAVADITDESMVSASERIERHLGVDPSDVESARSAGQG